MSQQPDHQFKLRLPQGLRDRLEAAAGESSRSVTAEIVWRLERSFLSEDLTAAKDNLLDAYRQESKTTERIIKALAAEIAEHLEREAAARDNARMAREQWRREAAAQPKDAESS